MSAEVCELQVAKSTKEVVLSKSPDTEKIAGKATVNDTRSEQSPCEMERASESLYRHPSTYERLSVGTSGAYKTSLRPTCD